MGEGPDKTNTGNIYQHSSLVQKSDRTVKNNHKPAAVWFTGLSGAGKSTLASLGSGLIHIQKMTVAAMQMAEKNVWAHRS